MGVIMVFAGIEINNLSVQCQPMYEPKVKDVGIVLIYFSVGNECHSHQERYRVSTGKTINSNRHESPSSLFSLWHGGLFNDDDFTRELNKYIEDTFL